MLILRSISGFILGLAPVSLGLLFGLLFYNYQTNTFGIIAICVFTLLGIILGYKIFKLVRKIGFISFITAVRSTQHIVDEKLLEKERLKQVLENTIDFLHKSEESLWSPLTPKEVIKNLEAQIENIKNNKRIDSTLLSVEYAPTSSIQEIAMANNWSNKYLELSEEFDKLIKKI
jgi:xanthosine utilization system XapX-like protein